jgi:hypothetical protein
MIPSASENLEPELTLEELRALPAIEKNFTTPEGAILCLEEACRRHDIELACACRNFLIQGTLTMLDFDEALARDPQLRQKNAVLSERFFRQRLTEDWPDLTGVESFFIDCQTYTDGIVVVTQLQRSRMVSFSQHELLVAKTNDSWRVVSPLPDDL